MNAAVLGVCAACAAALDSDARFCGECGAARPVAAAAPDAAPQPHAVPQDYYCEHCGGDGHLLGPKNDFCPACRWLRPLAPDYHMDVDAFLWEMDAQAMNTLESLGPITAMARKLSTVVGRPWFEATVNGVRLGEQQFPDIFALAVRAARIMGLAEMPEIYISGELLWDAMTLGSDEKSFIVIGSVLTYFKGDELLYLLGREMGHIRAGHVMWRTASKFLTGSTHMNRTIMGSGLLSALSPGKLVENAIDAAVMTWARHSEITADRAGMLVVGNTDIARKVVMSMSLKSFPLYQRLDQQAWREQEDASDDGLLRLSEATMSTMPYLARRLKMLREFGDSDYVRGWREYIEAAAPAPREPVAPAKAGSTDKSAVAPQARQGAPEDVWRFACKACGTPIRVARGATAGKRVLRVTCPKTNCRKEMNLRPPRADDTQLRFACVRCRTPVAVPKSVLEGRDVARVRCPKPECRCVMDVAARQAT
jgi:Zn-dependent protease with chaperone function